MGVKGFWTFIRDQPLANGGPRLFGLIDFAKEHGRSHFSKPVLVIDGMSIVSLLYEGLAWEYCGEWLQYLERVKSFFTNLLVGMDIIMIFDGSVEESKLTAWLERRKRELSVAADLFSNLRNGTWSRSCSTPLNPPTMWLALANMVSQNFPSIKVRLSCGEADVEVMACARSLGDRCLGVLSSDTDFFFFDSGVKWLRPVEGGFYNKCQVEVYDNAPFCRRYALERYQLPLLACLVSNDNVSREILRSFHCAIVGSPRWSTEILIEAVSKFVRTKWINGSELAKSTIEQLQRQTMPEAEAGLLSSALHNYRNEQWNLDHCKLMSSPNDVPFHVFELVHQAHHQTEIEKLIVHILCGISLKSSTCHEDPQDHTLGYPFDVFFPMNQMVAGYVLRGMSRNSFEIVRSDAKAHGQLIKVPVENIIVSPDVSFPNCMRRNSDVPLIKKFSVLKILLKSDLNDVQMETNSAESKVLMTLLRYLHMQVPVIQKFEFFSLIKCSILVRCADKEELRSIINNQPVPRALHLSSLFLRGLSSLRAVFQVCGLADLSRVCVPWLHFDGKLFHQIYAQASVSPGNVSLGHFALNHRDSGFLSRELDAVLAAVYRV